MSGAGRFGELQLNGWTPVGPGVQEVKKENMYFKLVQSNEKKFRSGLSCLKRADLAKQLVSPHQQGSSLLVQLVYLKKNITIEKVYFAKNKY